MLESYKWLIDHYEDGDELFFFGFSRGAFTARSLAGLVRNSGILRPENKGRVKRAYRLYRDPRKTSEPSSLAARQFRRQYAAPRRPTSRSSGCGTPSARSGSRSARAGFRC